MKNEISNINSDIQQCTDGKYRWTYEVNMLRSPVIMHDVFWVLGVSAIIVFIIHVIIMLLAGELSFQGLWYGVCMVGLVCLILLVLSFPAYWIVAKKNGNKYVVLHEMDETGLVHTQMKRNVEHEKVLMWVGILAGLAAGRPGVVGASINAATVTSLSSTFSKVKRVKAMRRHHLIKVNSTFSKNRVFVTDKDFDFVFNYISSRCVNAKIS